METVAVSKKDRTLPVQGFHCERGVYIQTCYREMSLISFFPVAFQLKLPSFYVLARWRCGADSTGDSLIISNYFRQTTSVDDVKICQEMAFKCRQLVGLERCEAVRKLRMLQTKADSRRKCASTVIQHLPYDSTSRQCFYRTQKYRRQSPSILYCMPNALSLGSSIYRIVNTIQYDKMISWFCQFFPSCC